MNNEDIYHRLTSDRSGIDKIWTDNPSKRLQIGNDGLHQFNHLFPNLQYIQKRGLPETSNDKAVNSWQSHWDRLPKELQSHMKTQTQEEVKQTPLTVDDKQALSAERKELIRTNNENHEEHKTIVNERQKIKEKVQRNQHMIGSLRSAIMNPVKNDDDSKNSQADIEDEKQSMIQTSEHLKSETDKLEDQDYKLAEREVDLIDKGRKFFDRIVEMNDILKTNTRLSVIEVDYKTNKMRIHHTRGGASQHLGKNLTKMKKGQRLKLNDDSEVFCIGCKGTDIPQLIKGLSTVGSDIEVVK